MASPKAVKILKPKNANINIIKIYFPIDKKLNPFTTFSVVVFSLISF